MNSDSDIPQPAGVPATSTPPQPGEGEDLSLFEMGALLLEKRFTILAWALAAAVLAVAPTFLAPSTYTSSATIISATGTPGPDLGLRRLVGQFGVGEPTVSSPTTTPAFLIQLASSQVILARIVEDSLPESEQHDGVRTVLDVLIPPEDTGDLEAREEEIRRRDGIRELAEWISVTRERETDAIRIQVTSRWPALSFQVARRLLEELNTFNLEISQASASEERRFVEQRLVDRERRLRDAEERMAVFLATNREFRNSPELIFQFDRLQREVALQQEVLIGLAQSNEEVGSREVRDIPVLTVIEPPLLPLKSDPRGRFKRIVLGLFLGGSAAFGVALVGRAMERREEEQDPEVERFLRLLQASLGPFAPRRIRQKRQ